MIWNLIPINPATLLCVQSGVDTEHFAFSDVNILSIFLFEGNLGGQICSKYRYHHCCKVQIPKNVFPKIYLASYS